MYISFLSDARLLLLAIYSTVGGLTLRPTIEHAERLRVVHT